MGTNCSISAFTSTRRTSITSSTVRARLSAGWLNSWGTRRGGPAQARRAHPRGRLHRVPLPRGPWHPPGLRPPKAGNFLRGPLLRPTRPGSRTTPGRLCRVYRCGSLRPGPAPHPARPQALCDQSSIPSFAHSAPPTRKTCSPPANTPGQSEPTRALGPLPAPCFAPSANRPR